MDLISLARIVMDATQSKSASGNGHPNRTSNGDEVPESPGESFSAAMSHFAELRAYFAQYIGAKVGGLRTSVRNLVIYAVLGVLGLLAGGAMIVTAASIIVIGLAQAVSHLLGDRMWAGNLIVGVLLLGAVVGTVILVVKKLFNSSRQATVNSHERRLKQQRVTLAGHDARQRSAEYIAEQQ